MSIEVDKHSSSSETAYQEGHREGYQLCISDLMILLKAWEANREELLEAAGRILEKEGTILGFCTPGIRNECKKLEKSQKPKVEMEILREGGPEKRV
jgi:hypothetical protein